MAAESERVLLRNSFRLSRYDVQLEPDFERFTFNGTVKISVAITEACKTINLHSKELCISAAEFQAGTDVTKAVAFNFNLEETTLEVVFEKELPTGDGAVVITFVGAVCYITHTTCSDRSAQQPTGWVLSKLLHGYRWRKENYGLHAV